MSAKVPVPIRLERYSMPEPNSGCILWIGRINKDTGYGQLACWAPGTRRKYRAAHRLAWEAVNGTIPTGLLVCHKCDTPPCINPDHMFLGTNADNSADKVAKGRARSGSGPRGGANPWPGLRAIHGRDVRPTVKP